MEIANIVFWFIMLTTDLAGVVMGGYRDISQCQASQHALAGEGVTTSECYGKLDVIIEEKAEETEEK